MVCYIILFAIWQGTFKSDWYTLYNINVAVAKKFNELSLVVAVVFNHPPGAKWRGNQEKAQPLKLIFTDQSKVSTSAGKTKISTKSVFAIDKFIKLMQDIQGQMTP